MKRITSVTKTASGAGNGSRRGCGGVRSTIRSGIKAATDRQAAEIERTFSVRWEW